MLNRRGPKREPRGTQTQCGLGSNPGVHAIWTPYSPVKLWFSIKLIATEFFQKPFNCWMAI